MSAIDFGDGDMLRLRVLGPLITAVVTPPAGSVQPHECQALIDTGASEICIDAGLANDLGLPIVDRQEITTPSGRHSVSRFLAQVDIPGLDIHKRGLLPGIFVARQSPYRLLIGRDILAEVRLVYHGPDGSGSISLDA